MKGPFAIFNINNGPYHLARLLALKEVLPEILGVEIASNELKYQWNPLKTDLAIDHVTLFDQPYESVPVREQQERLTELLEAVRPRLVMVLGYVDPAMRRVAMWAKSRNVPCVMTTDTHFRDKRRGVLKEAVKRIWVQTFIPPCFCRESAAWPISKDSAFPKK